MENLDAQASARSTSARGEAVGDRIIVGVDVDVIVTPTAAPPSLYFVSSLGSALSAGDRLLSNCGGDTRPPQALLSLSWVISSRGGVDDQRGW